MLLVAFLGHTLRRLYWRLARPTTLGSRCLVIRDGGVLLVRHTYGPQWYLPGGGVQRGESFIAAAQRELREETSIDARDLCLFGLYHSRLEGKNDHIAVFLVERFEGSPMSASAEVADVAFFPMDDLPPDISPGSRRRIEDYRCGRTSGRW